MRRAHGTRRRVAWDRSVSPAPGQPRRRPGGRQFRGRSSIALTDLVMKERRLIGTLAYRFDFPATIGLIARGTLPVRDLVTRRIDMAEIVSQGFERLRGVSEEIKILVRPAG